jgi:uncharacterized protein
MTSLTDVGFMPMRLGKVVAVAEQDGPSFYVVLEGVAQDVQLPILIGEMEAFNLAATLTGVRFGRPMGPQFAAGLLRALGGTVRQVRIDRLVAVHGGTAYGSTVEVEGPTGVELVDARPSDALNLVALVPAPIVVAPEVLTKAHAGMAGDSPDAVLLRRALKAEQMSIQRHTGIYGPEDRPGVR